MDKEELRKEMLSVLSEVFSMDADEDRNPEHMRVLVRRIPILCTNIETMHQDISELKDNTKWAVRIILGAVILALLKLIFIP